MWVLMQVDGAAEGGWLGLILPFAVMIVFFYFFILRPQQRHASKRREMLDSLRRGDQVVTIGGIHGEITAIHDDQVRLRIADDVEITMNRTGIGQRREAGEES